ncbi:TatD family hydrolase [Methylophilus methylotrophus]|uniref:TatD family hydrolase n=1 Tax=Methylophilus methylotrophus TaxID=17 RepID=UPI0003680A5C|nr:TatD family hydrolase [Methylophilus methylotrophus]
MLIDTHCHLDASEFDADRDQVWREAQAQGVRALVIPAVMQSTFQPVMDWCAQHPHTGFALGWHPLFVDQAADDALQQMQDTVAAVLAGPQAGQLLAIGEIGLDFYVTRDNEVKQVALFEGQLQIAKQFGLPVILHVRAAVDSVLKYLRKHRLDSGIAHAFNGSLQQATIFTELGFKLGFGGAMTWPRALKIRKLAAELPVEALVLETDAPDIPPVWVGHHGRNTPGQLKRIAEEMALIRGLEISQLIEITGKNSMQVLPKLAYLCT